MNRGGDICLAGTVDNSIRGHVVSSPLLVKAIGCILLDGSVVKGATSVAGNDSCLARQTCLQLVQNIVVGHVLNVVV